MSVYVELDLPDDRLLRAVTEEASMTDADLDELEARLLNPTLEASAASALALQIARAGRPRSTRALRTARTRLTEEGAREAVRVLDLALDLVEPVPPTRVERADGGYRHAGTDGEQLFVEDPLAAYWHRRDRWGPPLRPDPLRAAVFLSGPAQVERGARLVAEGATALVTFEPRGWAARPVAPLFLTRAGLARDVRLDLTLRWSQVLSIGTLVRGDSARAAFELAGEPRIVLPERASIPTAELTALLQRLVEAVRH